MTLCCGFGCFYNLTRCPGGKTDYNLVPSPDTTPFLNLCGSISVSLGARGDHFLSTAVTLKDCFKV